MSPDTFLCSTLFILILFFGGIIALLALQMYWVAVGCLAVGMVAGLIYIVYLRCQPSVSVETEQPHRIPADKIRIVQRTDPEEKYETKKRESKV